MIELKCPKELILTKPMVNASVLFVIAWYFLNINFRFQPEICHGCHDLKQKTMSFNDVAIVTVKRNDYMSKDKAINLFLKC